ncbi:MAG: NAD(P)/FAD-dependent oxidoreductase [Betaproteobacteria bacterium]
MNKKVSKSIAIIGAGIAGLSCAVRLKSLGHQVELFEKGRGPAGRMSTKRGDDWTADHGAQYFTARDPLFIKQVEQWLAEDVAAAWNPDLMVFEAGQWTTSQSKDIRYVGTPGMNAPAKQLAKDLTIHSSQTIDALNQKDGKWYLHSAESGDIAQAFDELVLAIPGPQAFALAKHIHPDIKALTESSNMKGCWTIMARFKEKQNVPFDAAFVNKELISWMSRNLSKPARKGLESWTIHANADWSHEFIELDKEQVTEQMLACAKKVGLDCASADIAIHRWRYASGSAAAAPGFYVNQELRIGVCGDWLNGGRVEGGWLSGYQLANRIAQQ